MSTEENVKNRDLYKQVKPAELPDLPEGYGYIGKGIPNVPFLRNKFKLNLARIMPEGSTGYSTETRGEWHVRDYYVGVVRDGHYALPVKDWKRINYPPELNKPADQH